MTIQEAEANVGRTVFSKNTYRTASGTIDKLSPWVLEAYTGGTRGTFFHPATGRQQFEIADFLTPESAKFYPR